MSEWIQKPVDETPDPFEAQPDPGDAFAQHIESYFPRQINRRTVLAGLALAASTLVTEDRRIMDEHWGAGDTTVMIPASNVQTVSYYTDGLLGAPGFGGTHGGNITNAYGATKIFPRDYPRGFFWYAPRGGITPEVIGDRTTNFADKFHLHSLTLHCESEGGIIALTGALAARRPLRAVVLNCCPFDVKDAYQATGAKLITMLDKYADYQGDLAGKYITCLLDELHDNGWHNLFREIIDARADTMHGGDPEMLDSQAIFLEKSDLWGRTKEYQERQIFSPKTPVYLCRPRLIHTDETVRDTQADDKFIDWFARFGIRPQILELAAPGHANTRAAVQAAAPHLLNLPIPERVRQV